MVGCQIVNRLMIHFKMGDSGTYDRITGSLGNADFLLAIAPDANSETKKAISIQEAFDAPEVALKDIDLIMISSTQESAIFRWHWRMGGK